MGVGKSEKRVDAVEKVTGRAMYTGDFCDETVLTAKVLHSTIANGLVKSIDTTEAHKIPGVVKIITCFDVPEHKFPTPGHPHSLDPSHADIADRQLLNRRVRLFGDDIAAVIAVDEVSANRALKAMKVEYEEYEPVLSARQAMEEGADVLHEGFENNILAKDAYSYEGYEENVKQDGLITFEDKFVTPRVQHVHLENPVSYAYMEGERIVVVSSTQIPHIIRRIVGQALGIHWGKIRIIKPYVGGGFGNKQDALYEPLIAYLTTQVGGRKVKMELTREETFMSTRSRHAIEFNFKTTITPEGRLVTRYIEAISDQGAYASHGHSVVRNSVKNYSDIYSQTGGFKADVYTVYTNLGTSGAMRAYGIPQIAFACESHMENIAYKMGFDPIEFRKKNMIVEGYKSRGVDIFCYKSGLDECIEKGKAHIDWDNKWSKYKEQSGNIRKGVGMSIFCYKTGVYPFSLEISSSRMVLNQDGSVGLQMGATEIGQGADTVFCQMTAETVGLKFEDVHITSTQDTDVTPFDLGAYASRQTYVAGKAIKQTAEMLKEKILEYAQTILEIEIEKLDINNSNIIHKDTQEVLITLEVLATNAFYNRDFAVHISAESSVNCKQNTYALGTCFAEISVDMELGAVEVLNIINVHDSGKIINPALAAAQVHGGMSMGLGYSLSEEMLYDDKGRLLNGNLLDYKVGTSLDTPELHVGFVEPYDPSGPYGNKALGEPPAIPVAPAIRNALFNATGVRFNSLPLNPEKLVMAFKKEGLI